MSRTAFPARTFKQCVSWLTLLCFVGTSVSGQLVFGAGTPGTGNPHIRQAEKQNTQAVIPYRYGRITDGKFAGGNRLVVYIQDLHCNPEIQNNIANILASLDGHAGISKIFLEGAPEGKLNAALFDTVSNKKLRAEAIDRLLNKGLLSGAEYYALQSEQNKLYGMENWDTYTANLDRYRKLFAVREESRKISRDIGQKIMRLKRSYLDKKIKRIENTLKIGKNENRYARMEKLGARVGEPIGGYPNLSRYVDLLKLNRAMRRTHVNEEMVAYTRELRKAVPMSAYRALLDLQQDGHGTDEYYRQLGELGRAFAPGLSTRYPGAATFFASLRLQYQINPICLVEEENEFQDRVLTKFAERSLDRDLVFLSRMVEDMGSFAELKMTSTRYTYFDENKQQFTDLLNKYFDEHEIAAARDLLNNPEYAAFYAANFQRNGEFVTAVLRGAKTPVAAPVTAAISPYSGSESVLMHLSQFKEIDVVIAGGFHQDVTSMFKEKGVSCLAITPNITRAYDERLYEQVMTGTIDLRDMMTSAIAPILTVLGIEKSRLPAEVAALLDGVHNVEDAAQLIRDLQQDPLFDSRFELKAVVVEPQNGNQGAQQKELEIFLNGRLVFVLAATPDNAVTIKWKEKESGLHEKTFSAADENTLKEIEGVATAALEKSKEAAEDATKAARITLKKFVRKVFQNFFMPPMIFKNTLSVADMDETLAPLRLPMTHLSTMALIWYLKAGGEKLIITGGPLVDKVEKKGARERVIEPIIAQLREDGEDLSILERLHIMTNSGAEQWEYSREKEDFELKYLSDMQDDLGRMDPAGQQEAAAVKELGTKRIYEIRRILMEILSGEWVDMINTDADLLTGFRNTFKKNDPADPAFRAELVNLIQNAEMVAALTRATRDGNDDWRINNGTVGPEDSLKNNIDMRVAEMGTDEVISTLTQITFNPLGRDVKDTEVKAAFDKSKTKRAYLAWYLNARFEQMHIPVAGTVAGQTSIDIKPKGRTKAYGVRMFIKRTFNAPTMTDEQADAILRQIGFMGDSLGEVGNDTAAALLMKWVVRVMQPATGKNDVHPGLTGKIFDTEEIGVEKLIPFINVMAIVAAITRAIHQGGGFADVVTMVREQPENIRGILIENIFAAQKFARSVTQYITLGAAELTPFQKTMYADPVLSAALSGKVILRVVPGVNPDTEAIHTVFHANTATTKHTGVPAVAVAIRNEPQTLQMFEEESTEAAGKIAVPYGGRVQFLKVVQHETVDGVVLSMDVPARYAADDTFLKEIYPLALAALADALTHGDIIAERTGIVPWLVDTTGLALGERAALFESLRVAVSENITDYTTMALHYKDAVVNQDNILTRGPDGVTRQGGLMIRADINNVSDPIGDSEDPVIKAQHFIAQFDGLSDVQFDSLLQAGNDGSIAEVMPVVVAALKKLEKGRIVLSVQVSLPQDAGARETMAHTIAKGIADQLHGQKGLGVRLMFDQQPDAAALQSFVETVAAELAGRGVAPETTVLVDAKDKNQADVVRAASMHSGMSGLKAIQSVTTIGAAAADALEVTVSLENSDMTVSQDQLTAIMSSPNANLVVLHIDGRTPTIGQQDMAINLGRIRAAAMEFITFRQPANPAWWKDRGARDARGTFNDILRLSKGPHAPAVMRALAQGLVRAVTEGTDLDTVLKAALAENTIDELTVKILTAKLASLRKLIDKAEDGTARAARSGMMAGFMESLLGEVLYYQMPGKDQLSEEALQKSGESDRVKKFLTSFALAPAHDDADMSVLLMKMQAGIVPVPSDEAEMAELKQRVRSFISAHNDDHETVYSVLKCAEALGLGLSSVSERFDVSEKVPVGAQPGSAEALLVEFLLDARTLNLEALRNKVTAFLNQPDHDAAAQAMAIGLYMVLLKAEFSKGVLEQGAEVALPAVREVARILSAA